MREIKFRGKSKKIGEWFYGYILTIHSPDRLFIMDRWHNIGGEATIKDELFCSTVEVIPETIGEFTGLLDKNGKEIWEGDILKSEGDAKVKPYNFNIEFHSPWWELSEVVFYDGRFCQVTFAQENSYYGELPSHPRDIFQPSKYKEVIGNIYENFELFKGETK